jgi:hypothetical protein
MTQSGNRAAWRSEQQGCLEAAGVLLGTKRTFTISQCAEIQDYAAPQIAAQYPDNGRNHG